jgi:hypothetical protein
MKVKLIRKLPDMKEYLALEDGSIIVSAGDHPGPKDISLHINKGETFCIENKYKNKNFLEIITINT